MRRLLVEFWCGSELQLFAIREEAGKQDNVNALAYRSADVYVVREFHADGQQDQTHSSYFTLRTSLKVQDCGASSIQCENSSIHVLPSTGLVQRSRLAHGRLWRSNATSLHPKTRRRRDQHSMARCLFLITMLPPTYRNTPPSAHAKDETPRQPHCRA